MAEKKLNKKEKFAAMAKAKENIFTPKLNTDFPKWWAYLPALLGFIVYANTLNFGFVLDDYAAILENTSTQKGFAALSEIFTTSYRYGYILISDELYRPLPKAIFAIFWELWPNNAVPGHWLNVILFSFTCYLIFKLMSSWFPNQQKLALLAALIFAAHPIHTEVVANIKSLDEILAFILCLFSLDRFIDYRKNGKMISLFTSMILLFFGLMCKESSITFLLIYPLLTYFTSERNIKESIKGVYWMLIPAAIFLLIRHQVLNSSGMFTAAPPSVADNALMYAKDPLTKLTGAVAMLGFYLYKLILPLNLSFDLSYPQITPASISDWQFILSALVLISLLVFAIREFNKRSFYGFALLYFFITVSVSSNIFMRIGTHYGERLMYVPSFAIALLLSYLMISLLDKKEQNTKKFSPVLMTSAAAILLFYSGLSIARNPVWKSNESLYDSGLISAPNSARAQYYVGLYKVKTEYLETLPENERDAVFNDGVVHLKKSVELYPYFTDAWTQLGIASYRVKNYPEALKYYDQAIKLNPYDPVVLNNSGSVYFDMQNYTEALQRYQQAVKYKPDYADAYMNIGSCYGVGGQYDLALQNLERAVQINPNLTQAYYFMGVTWRNKGNEAKALEYFEKAKK